MKKIVVLLIMFLIIPSFSDAYIDLDSNHSAYEDIIELNERNMTMGYPDNTFRPDSYITEEELAAILLRAANLEVCKELNNWPYDYIELGIKNGIVVDNSLVTQMEFVEFIEKFSILSNIKNSDNYFKNSLSRKSYVLEEIGTSDGNLTRAEVCKWVNKLIKSDGKVTIKELPQEVEVYYSSNEEIDISTTITTVEIFEYDSYDGKYAQVINQIKEGAHPYLKGRNKNAKGNYIVAIQFDTINNSKYGVWTSYKSLKFEDMEIKDAFDVDEINYQLLNYAYDSILIKPNENYTVTAFYIVDEIPEELAINRDITTLYNLQTHEYTDAYYFGKINVKF